MKLRHFGVSLGAVVVCFTTGSAVHSAAGRAAQSVTVSGVVVSDDAPPRPVRRAIVTATSDELPEGLSVITADDGGFSIAGLPAGRFTIVAKRAGYLPGAMGARKPGRQGVPVALAAGQSFQGVITLGRPGVMTGVVRDERGAPMAGLRMFAIDARDPQPPSPSPADPTAIDRTAVTDDRGVYRLYGLPPGTYLVCAAQPTTMGRLDSLSARSSVQNDAIFARLKQRSVAVPASSATGSARTDTGTERLLTPIFFPGTPSPAEATRITLSSGDVRDGLDFAMTALPASEISGSIVNAEGPLPASIQLSITTGSSFRIFVMASVSPKLDHAPGADGSFRYTQIAPGHYVIMAKADRATSGGRGRGGLADELISPRISSSETMYAVEALDVGTTPVSGVTLRLQRGATVSGRLVTSGAAGQDYRGDLTQLRISLQSVGPSGYSSNGGGGFIGNAFAQPMPVGFNADGTFQIVGVAPGRYHARVTVPANAAGWWPRSVMSGNRDVIDSVLDLGAGDTLEGLVATLTNESTELTGTLTSGSGSLPEDTAVIVLPVDPLLREAGSRRLAMTRPGSDSVFTFKNLPSGNYLLVAMSDVDPDEWRDAEFLKRIAPSGVPVTVTDGGKTVRNLRVAGR